MSAPLAEGTHGVDVEAVARVVEGHPSVAGLAPGTGVEVATYLPGRRVAGIRVHEAGIEVHVSVRYGPALPEVAAEIRRAVAPLAGNLPVLVFVDDLEVASELPAPEKRRSEDVG